MKEKWLIVGLGNPGPEYKITRHNVGFLFVDTFRALKKDFCSKIIRKKTYEVFELTDPSIPPCVISKPLTYMNLSGIAVLELVKKYGIPSDKVIVVYDDVDISFGRMKFRFGGGAAGHKGVNSIIQKLGSRDFYRLRIGIGRPELDLSIKEWVLSPFERAALVKLEEILENAVAGIYIFFNHGLNNGMNYINGFRLRNL